MVQDYVPAQPPTAGQIISVVLQMSTFGVLCVCFTRRTSWIKNLTTLPLAIWLVLLIYVDSTLFVFASSIIVHGLGINSSPGVCEGGILLCLICYMTTKILIYYFLVERAYIVRGSRKPRLQTKLWLFNCFFMILPYTGFVVMNFVWRITYINDEGVCIIGMQKIAMLPLITFEVVVNVYLTLLFILPIRKLYSYKHAANGKLHRMATRSLVGSLATLTTSVANLTVLMVLHGEPGWICLTCCNADILFCVLVLHWVASKEKPSSYTSTRSTGNRSPDVDVGAGAGAEKYPTTPPPAQKDGREFVLEYPVTPSFWPRSLLAELPPAATTLPPRVTTEIHSGSSTPRSKSRNGCAVLQKTRGDEQGRGGVELGIRVRSEVFVDSARSAEEGWIGIGRCDSAERMV